MPSKVKKPKEKPFVLKVVLEGGEYKSSGADVLECLENFVKEVGIRKVFKGKCTLRLESGKLAGEIFFYPGLVKRLFMNKIYRKIVAKRLTLRLH